MPKTVAEIKSELIAKGYQGEPTPEILRQYGWEPRDPLAGIELKGPARTPEQLKDDLALLHEEMKARALPAQIINQVLRFGAGALNLFGPAGAAASTAVNAAANAAEPKTGGKAK